MFNNMKIGVRLALGFGFVLLMSAVIATCSVSAQRSMMNSFNVLTDEIWPKSNIAYQNIQDAYDYARAFSFIVTAEGNANASTKALENAHARLDDTVKSVNENVKKLESMTLDDAEKTLIGKVKERRAAYGESRKQVLQLKAQGQNEKALLLMFTETNDLQTAYINAWKDFIRFEQSQINNGIQTVDHTYDSAQFLLFGSLLAALVIGSAIGVVITRKLLRALGGEPTYTAQIAERIANGDLAVHVTTKDGDKTSLLFSIRKMRDNLADVVGQIRAGTDTIATAAGEIASGNMDLSSRTEAQASALEQTSASMVELTTTVKQNSANAHQANQLAVSASEIASKGGSVVTEVIETMGSINDSSKRIVDIISVIDGIAFQTNILALNAAVEAARAGEQGRGFAVVASEVRTLAQRSAGAAKEIKQLIDDSVQKVDQGTKLVDQAGSTMSDIVASIAGVATIISEISSASHEQTAGIQQINQAITQLDEGTQQNAALVEQAAAASQSLREQADKLINVVQIFKLGQEVATSTSPHVESSPPAARLRPAQTARRPAPVKARPALAVAGISSNQVTATTGDWEQF
ncbi:methyl-accepting chemotaxis protein [Herbaspirillum rhizosphaerae]|uniref:methyl-accepting chemotaxis protein n=1 Tax=Herbaspirillum rhizosphaerae TaxID=346179 RepID=UPI00067D6CF1|nr:methyl-accepting chemotaxis protein [Herbaspirillum rhizosphaerae]